MRSETEPHSRQCMTHRLNQTQLGAYLQLIRFPNTFTAVADVVAGFLIAGGWSRHWLELIQLMLAGGSIYAAGCALNDFCDRRLDAIERPFRPIPAGSVSPRNALLMAVLLFGLGLACSLWAGRSSFIVASVLVLAVVSYDAVAKQIEYLGPANMALCRALNLMLGMSFALSASSVVLALPAITFCYVFSLTVLSQFEVAGDLRKKALTVILGWFTVIAAILGLVLSGAFRQDAFIYLLPFVLLTGLAGFRAIWESSPSAVGKGVKYMVLGIVLLDSVYVAGVRGWHYALPVVFWLIPSSFFARYFRMH